MNILITGGSGFVGGHLSRYFTARGARVIATGTSPHHPLQGNENFEYVSADTTRQGAWQTRVADADVVINLAGKNIFKYWTESYKKQMIESRIQTTRRLVEAMTAHQPAVFLSTSAIGYYGDRGEEVLTEDSSPGNDFLARICVDWEHEAFKADGRVVIMRFGVILGKGGGALSKMIPAYKYFVGGPMASGRQWFPWMHIEDLTAAVDFICRHDDLKGVFNFCSPRPVRNKEFAATLGHVLKRPAVMRVPSLAIKLFMGEMGGALMSSQKGVPERLNGTGFQFKYPDLEKALSSIIDSSDDRSAR